MIAETLAKIHAEAMTVPTPWDAASFDDLLANAAVFLVTVEAEEAIVGFALGRTVLDETELLTIAIRPALQRQGHGRACLSEFETTAGCHGARIAHLDVAASNTGARGLYAQAGWQEAGRRKNYYRAENGRVDAILMQKIL